MVAGSKRFEDVYTLIRIGKRYYNIYIRKGMTT
ncbi:hypothetical protein QE390_004809 [Siphonobacter sp. SORGH_AS 1065]|nr:hypothetical protein [Siphonobacter sp. SORGH_AS_1065]